MSAVNTDTDTILEALNDKMDRDGNNLNQSAIDFDVVVEWQTPTAANNYTWYRKYASGWVEQGGTIPIGSATATLTYPIPLAYAVCPSLNGSTSREASSYDSEKHCNSYTALSFTYHNLFPSAGNGSVSWEVKGMAASVA